MIKWWNEKREWCKMTNGDAVKFFLLLPFYLVVGCAGWVKTWLLKKDFMGYPNLEWTIVCVCGVLLIIITAIIGEKNIEPAIYTNNVQVLDGCEIIERYEEVSTQYMGTGTITKIKGDENGL